MPVAKEKLVEFMTGLTKEQMEQAEAIFKTITEKGFIEFEEQGHSQELEGKAELPEFAAGLLKAHLADVGTIDAFFVANQNLLGEQKSYDLSAYKEKEA